MTSPCIPTSSALRKVFPLVQAFCCSAHARAVSSLPRVTAHVFVVMDPVERIAAALRANLEPGRLASCDAAVLDYCTQSLADDSFEWGNDAELAFEAIGPLLVESGACATESEARDLLVKLAPSQAAQPAPVEDVKAAGALHLPIKIGGLTLEESGALSRKVPKGVITQLHDTLTVATAADEAKLERRRRKEEHRVAAAIEARRQDAADSTSAPVIMRNTGAGGSRDIKMDDISVSNGGEELVSNASLTLSYGRRYGLVGRNGTGKTTFLRAFASRQIAGVPPSLQILHVEQEVSGSEQSALDCVLSCDAERMSLLAEEAELLRNGSSDGKTGAVAAQEARLREVYDRLVAIDAAGAPARASTILAGLSFDAEAQGRPTRSFSGGWRMRLALAQALFVAPDVLLLDEPTNHLDLHAVLWLSDFLATKWPGTVVVVSHARSFLNAVCTDIVHLQSKTFTVYRGDYDTFEAVRAERSRTQHRAAEAQASKRQHIQDFIDRFRFNAKRATLVQSRIKALQRMAEVRCLEDDPDTVFRFPEPAEATGQLISFNDVSFSYTPAGKRVFHNLSFGLEAGSRVAVVGPSGIGKSTLLGLVGGSLKPTEGHVQRSTKARIAVFAQHHVDGLDLSLSPLAIMARAYPGVLDQELRGHLGSFGISGPLALQPLYTLSGGQKSRVQFAKMTWTKPNLLLLDEPTNHLDMDAIDALSEGLATWAGGVLVVSHDQHFITAVADQLWVVDGGAMSPFEGTFEDYKALLVKQSAK